MDKMKLVSVIIPAYNVQEYIKRCLDSVLNQSYDQLEVFVVDDGSEDSTREVCETYTDNRLIVISQRNQGQASARNRCLELIRGDYVVFVDADDVIHPRAIECFLYAMEKECADVCIGDMIRINDNDLPAFQDINRDDYRILGLRDTWNSLFGSEHMRFGGACGKCYRSCLFNTVRFPEGRVYEDTAIMHELYGNCRKIIAIDQAIYGYTYRIGSTTQDLLTKVKP